VLPAGRVVRRELLVRADEAAEPLVIAQRLERNAVGRPDDLDAAFAHMRETGDVDLEHRRRRRRTPGAVCREEVRVEALQIGEAPVLVRRGRKRQLPVALRELSPHDAPWARSAGAGSAHCRRGP
jgi:hypothetical protein